MHIGPAASMQLHSLLLQVILTTHLRVKSKMSMLQSANRERRGDTRNENQAPYGHVNLSFTKPFWGFLL